MKKYDRKKEIITTIIVIILMGLSYYFGDTISNGENNIEENVTLNTEAISSVQNVEIPEYNGKDYVEINNNIPFFKEDEYTQKPFENYSQLDELGRCGVAYANICKDIMPPEGDKRGDISMVKPTGWKQKRYDGQYIYNRCHLIGYQLSDEDANELNLITGTRYFNVTGMLPFENKVAEYVKNNKNVHVLYRVTPVFKDDNLLASGVLMEASSVEDKGQSVSFNVFVYNIQPGISIDYKTGESWTK